MRLCNLFAFLFLCDLACCDRESLHRRLEHKEKLGNKDFLARELCVLLYLRDGDSFLSDEADLDIEAFAGIFGLLEQDLRCGNDVTFVKSDSCCTFEMIFDAGDACLFGCSSEKCVLYYEVINACFSECLTERGIFCYGDTLVVNDNAACCIFELFGEFIDELLLLGNDFLRLAQT